MATNSSKQQPSRSTVKLTIFRIVHVLFNSFSKQILSCKTICCFSSAYIFSLSLSLSVALTRFFLLFRLIFAVYSVPFRCSFGSFVGFTSLSDFPHDCSPEHLVTRFPFHSYAWQFLLLFFFSSFLVAAWCLAVFVFLSQSLLPFVSHLFSVYCTFFFYSLPNAMKLNVSVIQ